MELIEVIFAAIFESFLLSTHCAITTKSLLIYISNSHKFSESKHLRTKRWMKKRIGIKKETIPKWVYRRLVFKRDSILF